MTVARFEGNGPVARYWLANCEGFAVRGGVQGTVEELLRDADPFVTTRLVVRTRGRRRTVVPVAEVASVIPDERTVVVERPRTRRAARPPRQAPTKARTAARNAKSRTAAGASTAALSIRRTAAAAVPPARSAAVAARAHIATGTATAVARATALGRLKPIVRSLGDGAQRGLLAFAHSFRSLAHELSATAAWARSSLHRRHNVR